MLRHYLRFLLLSTALLLFTPAHSEMSLSVSSSLDRFDYNLDGMHLKLEKLSARWQLSPFEDKRLDVEQLKANRLIITLNEDKNKTGSSPLPNRIALPFPVKIAQADIAEVVIITGDERKTLHHVQFSFTGDTKNLRLKLMQASTPWGEAAASLGMGTIKPFSINGEVALKHAENRMPYDVKVSLSGDLNTLHFESDAQLFRQDDNLSILQISSQTNAPAAHLHAKGQLSLMGDYPISISVQVNDLHTGMLGDYPAALINADIEMQGRLQPEIVANIELTTHHSQWQDQPLSASGKLLITGGQIEQIEFQTTIANNQVLAYGNLGKTSSRLSWQADIANLSTFNKHYDGEAHAHGVIEGSMDNLAFNFNLNAQKLRLPNDIKIGKLQAQASISSGENGSTKGELKANAIQYGKISAIEGQAHLEGTRTKHQLNLSAQGKDLAFESTLEGGMLGANAWQGFLQQLHYTGKTAANLSSPAPLRIDGNGMLLEQASLQLNHGHANIETLQLSESQWRSKGNLSQITLADLPDGLVKLPDNLHGSPLFSANWNISAAESLNGNLNIWRESGDFTFTASNGKQTPLGLEAVKLGATFTDNQAEIIARLNGQNLGRLEATLGTEFSKTADGFALLKQSPLRLQGAAELQTLAWLPMPTSLMDADIDGQFSLTVQANGTFEKPDLSGNLTGEKLYFSLPSRGVTLSDGLLEAAFLNDTLLIKKATWQGGSGSVNADGILLLGGGKPSLDLNWNANQFTLLSRTDRLLTFTGAGKTTLQNDMLTITGKVNVDKGLLELAEEDAPVLGDDVVVLGAPSVTQQPALQVLLNHLQINLGDDFVLRGRGLNAELNGNLTLIGLTQYRPHTTGSIQVKKGTYMAYGQVLNIERGIFNFSGTIDNPGLNIRAMRNSKPVNAGIEITGSAFIPITKLVSDPNVAETEKLSWLVLGHGMDTAGKNDYGMLSLAAGVLLSQGQSVPLQTQLARAAGLDEFSFAGGDAESASLTFGKRLTSQLYLSYEKSMTGLLDVARLTFNITNRWSLRAEAGTESAVDVLYTFSFK